MARTKKVVEEKIAAPKKRVVKKAKNQPEETDTQINPSSQPLLTSWGKKRLFIVAVIIGLLLLAYYKKSWFVAAMVNNQPVTSLEVNQRLNQLYRTQILDQMINEKIIEQEAVKKGVMVTPKQINDRVAQTEQNFGGSDNFNALLAQQGVSRGEFTRQIKLQLLVEQIYKGEIQPTDQEVQQYMDANKNDPQASDSAKFKETATNTVKQQKLSKVFSEKFQALKQAAKIQIF